MEEKSIKLISYKGGKKLIHYFTSRILFLILAIIFISVATSFYVDASGLTLMQLFEIDSSKLNPVYVPSGNSSNRAFFSSEDFNYLYQSGAFPTQNFNTSNFHPPYVWDPYLPPVDNINVDVNDFYIICCRSYVGGLGNMIGYVGIPKYVIDDGIGCFTRNGFYATSDFDYVVESSWTSYTTKTFDSSLGLQNFELQQFLSINDCYFCSCPLWSGSSFVYDALSACNEVLNVKNDINFFIDESNYGGIVNVNYFLYDDISNIDIGSEAVNVESNINHLYLDSFNFFLTGSHSSQDIMQSSLVGSVSVDDWVLNHINDYDLDITTTFFVSPKVSSNAPEFFGGVTFTYPLKSFVSNIFSYGIYDLSDEIRDGIINMYFQTYYQNYVLSKNVKIYDDLFHGDGALSSLGNSIYKFAWGHYHLSSTQVDFDYFVLFVRVVLVDRVSGERSEPGIVTIDLMNGTQSITNSDILRNNNPWDGESLPQVNPYDGSSGTVVNSGGASGGASASNNTNIQINNNNSRLPLNVQSEEELDAAITRYGFVFQRTKEFFEDITEETSDNNFLQLIADTYPQVPYLDFMMMCCMSVIGMGVIIFVLKALLK